MATTATKAATDHTVAVGTAVKAEDVAHAAMIDAETLRSRADAIATEGVDNITAAEEAAAEAVERAIAAHGIEMNRNEEGIRHAVEGA